MDSSNVTLQNDAREGSYWCGHAIVGRSAEGLPGKYDRRQTNQVTPIKWFVCFGSVVQVHRSALTQRREWGTKVDHPSS